MRSAGAILLVLTACSELPLAVTLDGATPGADAGSRDSCGVPSRCSVVFTYDNALAQSVELHGSFNGWKTGLAMARRGSTFATSVELGHGERVEYKFRVDGSTWLSDPKNPLTTGPPYDNSILEVGCPGTCADGAVPDHGPGDGTTPPPFDWRDGVMYFVLVDRFADGNTANNKPEGGVPLASNFQGGDLAGVLARLKQGYFSQLGVSVIWLTSPLDAPEGKHSGQDGHLYTGYHGYWPVELDRVEERLGDLGLLKQVVDEAHGRQIRVVLDYVMNHVHESSSVYKSHPGWFWPLDLRGKPCVCGAGCSWAPPEGLRCWFDPFLPDFNFTIAEARSFSVDNAVQWIKDTGIDGYRLDAVKHVEESWLLALRQRIQAEIVKSGQRYYLVGETFDGDPAVLKQRVDPATKLDGQFDFPLRAQLVRVILMRQGGFADLDGFLSTNETYYGPGAVMSTFLGNHDLPRAIHLAEDTPLFQEWDRGKSRAWTNTPQLPGYGRPFERLAVAFTALLTLPGLPLIYYGDEIGMAGGGDPDNRRFMTWDGLSSHQVQLRSHVTKLVGLRRDHPALRHGKREQIHVSSDVYAYRLSHAGDQIVVVLNRSDSDETIQLAGSGTMKDLLSGETVNLTAVKVAARSSRVLR